jgi:hypothetical protein
MPDSTVEGDLEKFVNEPPSNATYVEHVDLPETHIALPFWQVAVLVSLSALGLGEFVALLFLA